MMFDGLPRLNRREWARGAIAIVTITPLSGQVTQKVPPIGLPVAPASPATPEQRLQKAYADIRAISDQLSKLEVPMDVEPAFAFHAF